MTIRIMQMNRRRKVERKPSKESKSLVIMKILKAVLNGNKYCFLRRIGKKWRKWRGIWFIFSQMNWKWWLRICHIDRNHMPETNASFNSTKYGISCKPPWKNLFLRSQQTCKKEWIPISKRDSLVLQRISESACQQTWNPQANQPGRSLILRVLVLYRLNGK